MTIKDIAKESGYAISTVSRALNNHPDVSFEAKKRIDEIVKRSGFVPNNNARQLKQQQSTNIAIIVKGSFNMFFAFIVEQLQSEINDAGYNVAIHYLDEDADEVLVAKQFCREHKPLGIIFLGGSIDNFKHHFNCIKVPCVLATASSEELQFANLSCVGIDDKSAAYLAADYLLACGHKNTAMLGGNLSLSYISRMRFEGYKARLNEDGLSFGEENYQKASFNYGSAYRAMNKIMASGNPLTAVFAASDVMAVGAMRAIFDAGLQVPKDISVLGFDGLELANYTNPKLATIRQPQKEIAHISVELLLNHISRRTPMKQRIVGVELVRGESVRNLFNK
jgi:LacI family transcriptional regulator